MGFYGNITNTSNTTFQFDRIYPNRMAMNANANNDGIFIGRYVLVEYDQDAAYPIIYTDGDKFYSSPNKEKTTQIKFETSDGFFTEEIGQVQDQDIETDNNGNLIKVNSIKFYQCIGGDSDGYAIFELFTSVNSNNKYIQNFAIDEKEFGNSTFKGYDSTVWTKVTETSNGQLITKYVNIADLNSVVPTFDIAADAPTMTPITPHFDADSTNVYYKLHMQSPYGFRVAASKGESDEQITWTTTTYDKTTDTTTTTTTEPFAGDIYYNKAGFNPEMVSKATGDNYIKLAPTAKSGAVYSHGKEENDIQEFSLHLPAIGNMMSDAWDIIHGPNRDDSDIDSLQGRLDFFKEKIGANEIPVRSEEGSYLVGSKINGDNQYISTSEKIETEPIITDFDTDDAWIYTKIDTEKASEVGYNQNAISIHHKWTDAGASPVTSNVNENGDTIELYIPKVDKAGHIVGTKNNTVTLPYGYKYFKTEGLANNKDDLYTENADKIGGENEEKTTNNISNNSGAHNTQDILTINPYNKWIQTKIEDTDSNGDTLIIAHEIHSIDERYKENTNLNDLSVDNENIDGNFTIYDWSYDEAGHIKEKREHTYTLPYGYKTINVGNNITESAAPSQTGVIGETADNTQDSLIFTPTNKWIKMVATGNDEIKFGHEIQGDTFGKIYYAKDQDLLNNDIYKQEPKFGDTTNILNITVDNAGHITDFNSNTIKIPIGKYEVDTPNTNANSVLVDLALDGPTGEITSKSATTNTLKLVDYSYIGDTSDTQKITSGQTINNAFGLLEKRINDLDYTEQGSNTQFVSKITQNEGIISVERANAGTLTLTGYIQGAEVGDINSGDTINSAFAKLQNQIAYEENRLNTFLKDADLTTNAIDTLKELQDYINEHGEYAANIVLSIENEIKRAKAAEEANAKAISDETTLARSHEEQLANAIIAEEERAEGAEKVLQDQIDALGSAAYTESSAYATAAQGELADNALPKNAEFIYTEEFKDTETDEVLIPEVKMTIEQLVKKVAELENEIKILKGE